MEKVATSYKNSENFPFPIRALIVSKNNAQFYSISNKRVKMKEHNDSIPEIAHAAALVCTLVFGATQLILRYFTSRLDNDYQIILMIGMFQSIA